MFTELRRHARLAEFRLLCAGLVLVGLALSAIGLFSERVESAMQARTSAILGADAMVSSTRPLDEAYGKIAREHGLENARSISFMSMAISREISRLAGVRAVSDNYPLRGELVLATDDVDGATETVSAAPVPGEFWAATQLVRDLRLVPGTEIQLGDAILKFGREILLEPEGGAGMLRLAPRLLINITDLDQTGLVTPASRARFRLLVAGDIESLSSYANAIEPMLAPQERWRIADIRQDEVRGTVGRIVSYIRLAVLLAVILAVVAMALAAQGLWGMQVHEIALMRCLGRKHGESVKSLAKVYMFAAIPSALLGITLGFLIQGAAVSLLERSTGLVLPPPSLLPWVLSLVFCLVSLGTVMLPILIAVKRVPTMTLLRSELVDSIRRNRTASLAIVILAVVLTLFLAQDLMLAGAVLAGLVVASLVLWLFNVALTGPLLRLMTPRPAPWYVALKSIRSNSGRSAWLASTFAATIFALVLLGGIRGDMFDEWEQSVPEDAPNLFLINIQSNETQGLDDVLAGDGVEGVRYYPIIRGRLVAIDGKDVSAGGFDDEEARHRINHEFNLTEIADLPEDNIITAGSWENAQTRGYSIEQETAELFDISVGGSISLDVGGERYEGPVTSIRQVKWDNMQPNFFIIASPGLLENAPRNLIAGVHVPGERTGLISKINQAYAGVTAIDLGMLLTRFRELSAQGSNAVSVVFLFTLAAAILVLVGILQGQRSARRKEIALLKTFGAGRDFVRNGILWEFALLGMLAGAVGGGLALLSGWLLANQVFEFDYSIPWRWLGFSILAGMFVVAVTGYASVRSLIPELPVRLLTRSGSGHPVSN